MTKESEQALQAASCLYIAVDESIADDIQSKIRAAINAEKLQTSELLAWVAKSHAHAAELEDIQFSERLCPILTEHRADPYGDDENRLRYKVLVNKIEWM